MGKSDWESGYGVKGYPEDEENLEWDNVENEAPDLEEEEGELGAEEDQFDPEEQELDWAISQEDADEEW